MFDTFRKRLAGWIWTEPPTPIDPVSIRIEKVFEDFAETHRIAARTSESHAFRDKYHTVADEVSALHKLVQKVL